MKKPFIIAWDFDYTLNDGLTEWIDWVNKRLKPVDWVQFEEVVGLGDDLVPYFDNLIGCSSIDFWKQPNLYDDMKPFDNEQRSLIIRLGDYITNLTGRPVEHIVVSKCMPEHIQSKKRYLEKHFEGVFSGFIDTADKNYVRFDAIFDDSYEVFKSVKPVCNKIVIPASHTAFDLSNEDPKQVMLLGMQGYMGSMWYELLEDESSVCNLAIWLTEN
ncbi:hypothetical protein Kuja_1480 [Vibrio phage vB_VchM_Kuja]|uniref:Uncharacterized protein n=1 Tax=Vibrio phage vB_VchM_Kuja TaxID=2686437 RepID=A0A6B9J9J2_9CAUD|nr:hypothetical protein HWC83_gp088 [Vibrio phage vB_VchM_Kuja]QGZ16139.1 hypothetical protein Kuja_1480 [Vibrio phage vB_VchM_Kuja]